MKTIVIGIALLLAGTGLAFGLPYVKEGVTLGPLILNRIEPDSHWVSVRWHPEGQSGKLNGRVTYDPKLAVAHLSIQLEYISPRGSARPKDKEINKRIFKEGLERLLAKSRSFAFVEIPKRIQYAGFGQTRGVFLVEGENGKSTSIQYEMVRSGYAVVDGVPFGSNQVRGDGSSFRDDLLRAEGMARALKLGVWANE